MAFERSQLIKENISKSRPGFSMPPHTSTHFEIQKHYQNEPKCNSDYSRNN